MFEELWFVRDATDDFNPDEFYGDRPEIFSLKFFHGGRFSSLPGRTYVNGKISFVHMVDSDQFSIHEIGDMVEKIGYPKEEVIHYHFRVPGHDLDFGLKGLVNDTDVLNLLKYVEDNKIIEIYIEHSGTRLSNNVIDDEVAHDDNVIDDELETDNNDSESEDSDFLIDEGDMVNEVVVDMNAFKTPVEMSMEIYDEDIADEELELDDFDSLSDEENDPPLKKVVKKVRKDKKKQKKDNVAVPFYVGQAFSNREEIKDLVKRHGVDSRRQLCIVRNDKSRFRVVCCGNFPESWVFHVYWLDTWKKVYQQTIDAINGRDLWAPSTCPTTITPPKHHKQIRRPKKKRRKSADELSQGIEKNGKMTRVGNTVTCGICKQKGHNKRSCKRSDGPQ